MNRLRNFWNSGLLGKVVIGCSGLLVFCCLCSIPVALTSPSTPNPVSTDEVSNLILDPVTEAIQPSDTAEPTNTPFLTITPEPTSTSRPTSTASTTPLFTPTVKIQTVLIKGASCLPDNSRQTGKVVDVVDGDTIKVLLDDDGQTYTVRYIGMDTPEYTTQVERFGAEAGTKNVQLVFAKEVVLIRDVSETDRYGRLLRYVIVDDLFVNYELVAQGYANTASFPPDIACIPTFQEAEQQAKTAKLGLWNVPATLVVVHTSPPSGGGSGGSGGGNAVCNCSGPDLNCKHFSTHASAQACHDYCISQGYGDVFDLDGNDNDGLACESLP